MLAHTKYSVSTERSFCKVRTHIITKLHSGRAPKEPCLGVKSAHLPRALSTLGIVSLLNFDWYGSL